MIIIENHRSVSETINDTFVSTNKKKTHKIPSVLTNNVDKIILVNSCQNLIFSENVCLDKNAAQ